MSSDISEKLLSSALSWQFAVVGPENATTTSIQTLFGMSIGDVFEEDEQEQANAFMGTWLEALIRTGTLSSIGARFIASVGRRVPILFSRTAMADGDGNITDILCIAKDMTGYKREDAV